MFGLLCVCDGRLSTGSTLQINGTLPTSEVEQKLYYEYDERTEEPHHQYDRGTTPSHPSLLPAPKMEAERGDHDSSIYDIRLVNWIVGPSVQNRIVTARKVASLLAKRCKKWENGILISQYTPTRTWISHVRKPGKTYNCKIYPKPRFKDPDLSGKKFKIEKMAKNRRNLGKQRYLQKSDSNNSISRTPYNQQAVSYKKVKTRVDYLQKQRNAQGSIFGEIFAIAENQHDSRALFVRGLSSSNGQQRLGACFSPVRVYFIKYSNNWNSHENRNFQTGDYHRNYIWIFLQRTLSFSRKRLHAVNLSKRKTKVLIILTPRKEPFSIKRLQTKKILCPKTKSYPRKEFSRIEHEIILLQFSKIDEFVKVKDMFQPGVDNGLWYGIPALTIRKKTQISLISSVIHFRCACDIALQISLPTVTLRQKFLQQYSQNQMLSAVVSILLDDNNRGRRSAPIHFWKSIFNLTDFLSWCIWSILISREKFFVEYEADTFRIIMFNRYPINEQKVWPNIQNNFRNECRITLNACHFFGSESNQTMSNFRESGAEDGLMVMKSIWQQHHPILLVLMSVNWMKTMCRSNVDSLTQSDLNLTHTPQLKGILEATESGIQSSDSSMADGSAASGIGKNPTATHAPGPPE